MFRLAILLCIIALCVYVQLPRDGSKWPLRSFSHFNEGMSDYTGDEFRERMSALTNTIESSYENKKNRRLHTITCAGHYRPEIEILRQSAHKYGHEVIELGFGHKNLQEWGTGLSEKIRQLKEFCSKVSSDDLVLMVDAWDVIIQGTPEQILEAYDDMHVKILFGFERGCVSNPGNDNDVCPNPEKQDEIHKGLYLCSGLLLARASEILRFLNGKEIPYKNDQTIWAEWYIKNHPTISLDTSRRILVNVFGSESELSLRNNLICFNSKPPMVVHFNGPAKEIMKDVIYCAWPEIARHLKYDETSEYNAKCKQLSLYEGFTNTKKNYTIICARYNNNTDFLDDLSDEFDVKVVQKRINEPYDQKYVDHLVINKANEATSYLSYIVKYYDNLPNNMIFIHDENESWHHSGKITENIKNWIKEYEKTDGYFELNNQDNTNKTELYFKSKEYKQILHHLLPDFNLDTHTFDGKCCAQFIISKKTVQRNTKEFYVRFLDWLIENTQGEGNGDSSNPYSGFWTGRYAEWLWKIIFTHKIL